MTARDPLFLALALVVAAAPVAAVAQQTPPVADRPPIADTPPPFRIYDIDKRERNMHRLLAEMAGTPALSHAAADRALGRLDDIHRQEMAMRARTGGRITVPIARATDAKLNALSRELGLREPAR